MKLSLCAENIRGMPIVLALINIRTRDGYVEGHKTIFCELL